MNHLVSNGIHLLKRSGRLVRTPLEIVVSPDMTASYQIAGAYTSGTVAWPKAGFIDTQTLQHVKDVGSRLVNATYNPGTLQEWRDAGLTHLPEAVWYQGAYAPSADTIDKSHISCEAYAQLCAYRFTLPSIPSDMSVESITVSFVNGGVVKAVGSAGERSTQNAAVTDPWYCDMFVIGNIYGTHPSGIRANQYDSINLSSSAECRGIRDVWAFGDSRDGAVPTLTTPQTVSYTMGDGLKNTAASLGCFWIVADPAPVYDSSSPVGYRPYYYDTSTPTWSAASCWDFKIKVKIS